MPRKSLDKFDQIYGEDPISLFDSAYLMEMYVNSPTGAEEQGEFFSKFGLEIRSNQNFILARRTFQKYLPDFSRPREGDLIYVPTFQNLYEIKFVEEEKQYYTLGRKAPYFYFYELQVELHKFSHDRFQTGNKEIDNTAREYGYSISLDMNPSGNGTYRVGEEVYQGPNSAFSTASAIVKSWNTNYGNTQLDIVNIIGVFANSTNVVGTNSGAVYATSDFDRQKFGEAFEDIVDNLKIEQEANNFINFDTKNPFGTP